LQLTDDHWIEVANQFFATITNENSLNPFQSFASRHTDWVNLGIMFGNLTIRPLVITIAFS